MRTAPATTESEEPGICDPAAAITADVVGSGPRGLMRAVLVDAIQCLVGGRRGGKVDPGEWRRTRRWILDRDQEWLFSFRSICRELDLDPTHLRRRLLASTVGHSNLIRHRRAPRARYPRRTNGVVLSAARPTAPVPPAR
jgi:hypothetical protein